MDNYKFWPLKISITTFFIGLIVSLLSEVASSVSGIVVATLIIVFLMLIAILTDGIGVAVTACNVQKIAKLHLESPDDKALRFAYRMAINAERVNNICADVIGDVCSIINGACGAAIVIEIIKFVPQKYDMLAGILVSSALAAITVGGKAYFKTFAIQKSDEFIIYSAKILSRLSGIFSIFNKTKKAK